MKAKPALTRIIPALVHIQAHLDQELSLDVLAGHVGLSKYHFHELFQGATGETPQSYVDRLRLEWAALQLRIRRAPVVDIALGCGYRNHETFSRAFRGRFTMSPREYRKQWCRRTHGTRRARFQRTPGGEYAITEYVGSWDLGPAYESIVERLRNMPTLDIIGLPAIEIYRTTQVGARDGLAQVSIAIPVSSITAR